MPSVSFSQTAIPFVAALVERLGGEVTVPARRMSRGDSLVFDRVSSGLRFRLMNRHEVIRVQTEPYAIRENRPYPVTDAPATKLEVEKVRDEEAFEIGSTLLKCDECGFRFEKFHKNQSGKEDCPYCEIRRVEAIDKTSEINRLRSANNALQIEAQDQAKAAERFAKMAQEKMELVTQKSIEIKKLRDQLAGRSMTEARAAVSADDAAFRRAAEESILRDLRPSRTARLQALRRANPGMALLDLVRILDNERPFDPPAMTPAEIEAVGRGRVTLTHRDQFEIRQSPTAPPVVGGRGGLRAGIDEVVARFGGEVQSHSMTTRNDVAADRLEIHNFQIVIPLRSQIT